MQISIKPPTFMWFLNSTVHLTEENPGPVEINFTGLNKDNQRLVILGIHNNQILCSELITNLKKIYNGEEIVKTSAFNVDEENPYITASEDDLKKMASTKLNQTVNHLRKYIDSCNDIRLLRVMLELESNTRSRKNIIETVNTRLTSLAMFIQKSISSETGNAIKSTLDPLADSFEINESIERVIEVVKEQ